MKRKLKLLSATVAAAATVGGLATGLVVGLDKSGQSSIANQPQRLAQASAREQYGAVVQQADQTVAYQQPLVAGFVDAYDLANYPLLSPPSPAAGYSSWTRAPLQTLKSNGEHNPYPQGGQPLEVGDVVQDTYTAVPESWSNLQPYKYVVNYNVQTQTVAGVSDQSLADGFASYELHLSYRPDLTWRNLAEQAQSEANKLSSIYRNISLSDAKTSVTSSLVQLLANADSAVVAGENYFFSFTGSPTSVNPYKRVFRYNITFVVDQASQTQGVDVTKTFAKGLVAGFSDVYDIAGNPVTDLPDLLPGYQSWQRQTIQVQKASGLQHDYVPGGEVLELGDVIVDTYVAEPADGAYVQPYKYELRYPVSQPALTGLDEGALARGSATVNLSTSFSADLTWRKLAQKALDQADRLNSLFGKFTLVQASSASTSSLAELLADADKQIVGGESYSFGFTAAASSLNRVKTQLYFVVNYFVDSRVAPTEYRYTVEDPLSWVVGRSVSLNAKVPLDEGYTSSVLYSLEHLDNNGQSTDYTNRPEEALQLNSGSLVSVYEVRGDSLPSYFVKVVSAPNPAYVQPGGYAIRADLTATVADFVRLPLPDLGQEYSGWTIGSVYKIDEKSGALKSVARSWLQSAPEGTRLMVRWNALTAVPAPSVNYDVYLTVAATKGYVKPEPVSSFKYTYEDQLSWVAGLSGQPTFQLPLEEGYTSALHSLTHVSDTGKETDLTANPAGAFWLGSGQLVSVYEVKKPGVESYFVKVVSRLHQAKEENGVLRVDETNYTGSFDENGMAALPAMGTSYEDTWRLQGVFAINDLSGQLEPVTLDYAQTALPGVRLAYRYFLRSTNSEPSVLYTVFKTVVQPAAPAKVASFRYTVEDKLSWVTRLSESINADVPLDHGYTSKSLYSLTQVDARGVETDYTYNPAKALTLNYGKLVSVYAVSGPNLPTYYVKVVSDRNSARVEDDKIKIVSSVQAPFAQMAKQKMPDFGSDYEAGWVLQTTFRVDSQTGELNDYWPDWNLAIPPGVTVAVLWTLKSVSNEPDVEYLVYHTVTPTPGAVAPAPVDSFKHEYVDNLSRVDYLTGAINFAVPLDVGYTSSSLYSVTHVASNGVRTDLTSNPAQAFWLGGGELISVYEVKGQDKPSYFVKVVSKSHNAVYDNGVWKIEEPNYEGPVDAQSIAGKLPLLDSNYRESWQLSSVAYLDPFTGEHVPSSLTDISRAPFGTKLALKYVNVSVDGRQSVEYTVYTTVTDSSQPSSVDGVRYAVNDPLSWVKGFSTQSAVYIPIEAGYDQKRLVSLTFKDKDGDPAVDITYDPLSPSLSSGGTVESLYEVSGQWKQPYRVLVTSLVNETSEANGFINVEAWNVSGPLGQYGAPDLVLPKLSSDYSQQWYLNGMFEYDRYSGQLLPITANQLQTRGKGYSFIVRYVAPRNSYGPGFLYTVHYTIA